MVCDSEKHVVYRSILHGRVTVVHLNIDENEDFGVEISQDLAKYWKLIYFILYLLLVKKEMLTRSL